MPQNKEVKINKTVQSLPNNRLAETITLENIEDYSTQLSKHQLKWMFEDSNKKGISSEVNAQIIPLEQKAAEFLAQKQVNNNVYNRSHFIEKEVLFSKKQSPEAIKTWLYERNIPLDRKVFWVNQLNIAFVMTWRMVIKYSDILFFGTNEVLWDKTMNWKLSFDSNEVFHFTSSSISNVETRLGDTKTKFTQAVRVQDKETRSRGSHGKVAA